MDEKDKTTVLDALPLLVDPKIAELEKKLAEQSQAHQKELVKVREEGNKAVAEKATAEQKLQADVQKAAEMVAKLQQDVLKAHHVTPITSAQSAAANTHIASATPVTAPIVPRAKPTGSKMQLVNCRLKLDQNNDVPLARVTPGELLYLVADHHLNVKDNPIHAIEEIEEGFVVDIGVKGGEMQCRYATDDEVLQILLAKYPAKKVKAVYAGATPRLPNTVKEAIDIGVRFAMPQDKLGSFSFGK